MEQKKFEFNENNYDGTMNMNSATCNMNCMPCYPSTMCEPIQECPQERVCHRYICYEVPPDCQFMLYTKYGMNLHT